MVLLGASCHLLVLYAQQPTPHDDGKGFAELNSI